MPARLIAATAPSLRPVINATGVILHTNLGRAPLARAAVDRVAALSGYTNLEYDLDNGGRGRRDVHAEQLLCRLTGAEAAVVVNNNAAATLLALAALAAGREVIVSRGELVEIGGGFRIPDVMRQSGAILREVGTTNRTRAADYATAISDRTAALLRVHPSNFRIEGFTERPALGDLVSVARPFDLPVIEDIGSGWIGAGAKPAALADEPTPRDSLAAGAAVVLFSGDKLLGGPQAGIIAGRATLIDAIRRHPLMRALRVDKMTYAALEATLQEYAAERAATTIPVVHMLALGLDEIRRRAQALTDGLRGNLTAELVDGFSTIGGGSAPGSALPTALVAVRHAGDARERAGNAASALGSSGDRAHPGRPRRARPADRPGRSRRPAARDSQRGVVASDWTTAPIDRASSSCDRRATSRTRSSWSASRGRSHAGGIERRYDRSRATVPCPSV